jgi:arylsulfatase A-like enzyme
MKLGFAAAAALALAAACTPGTQPPRTSVLLVTVDTLRADRLSCAGYPRPTTPSIDALAARGVRFERAWSHAPETGPSLATVLTSRRATVTGVRGNAERLDPALPTLATVARASGLRTAAFVSTVLLRRDACAFDRGFETYDDAMTDPCFGHERAQRVAERTVDAAVAWLGARREPFLLWVHLYDPHGPYTPPQRAERLDATRGTLRSVQLDAAWIPRYQRVGASLDAADYADRYDHEIAYADLHVGRLLATVDPATTLVVLHADHGEALGEDRYWFRHGSLLHDAALRVPWIVAGPGVPRGRAVAGDVRLVDLAPTLTALAGLPSLPAAEGRDLSAVVRGTADPPPFEHFAEARRREIVVDATGIDAQWKVRRIAPASDVTYWPAKRVSDPPRPDPAALAAIVRWIEEGPRASVPPPPAGDLPDALRGLGYGK